MTTMIRLAKRNETPYSGKLIYLENENRKIVFSGDDNYASIFAVGHYFSVGESSNKKSYQTHSTLDQATAYRRIAGEGRGLITIDKQGYIYDLDFADDSAPLVKSNDMVILSPMSFLNDYNEIADAYALVLSAAAYIKDSEVLTDNDKAKAHQLKELAYKVVTLFKHTHELTVSTCMEFNDDFFNPNPAYAEKTLKRINVLAGKLAELLGGDKCAARYIGSQYLSDNIDHAVNLAIERTERDDIRHSIS